MCDEEYRRNEMIGFIGGGNMAEALVRGLVESGKKDILVSEPREERRRFLESSYGVKTTADNLEVVSKCRIFVLAVKPQMMSEVLDVIAPKVTAEHTVVSIAAGVTLAFLRERLKTVKIVRTMPNAGAFVGEGMTAMSLCECFPDNDINIVRDIFMSSGRVVTLPEKYIDVVTALSGSGPAFVALFIESMVESAVKLGLSNDDALALAVQTLNGTAKLLDSGISPVKLREMVTSPGGTTAEGIKVFEARGLRAIVEEALTAAKCRAGELSK